MTAKSHHFSIGDIRLIVIADAIKDLAEERVVEIAPTIPEEGLKVFRQETHPHIFCYNMLYLHNGSEHILVDTGSGEAAKPDAGHLVDALAQEGIPAADVDKIIITHFHGDHYAGLVTPAGEAVFPKAQLLVPGDEWAYWLESGKAPAERMELIRAAFAQYDGRIRYFTDGEPLAMGITAIAMPGHTAGHSGLMIQSQNQRLLHLADTLHLTLQFALPDVSPKFDYQPEKSAKTRWEMLGRAADESLLTSAYHIPFPGLGYVERQDKGFAWKPI